MDFIVLFCFEFVKLQYQDLCYYCVLLLCWFWILMCFVRSLCFFRSSSFFNCLIMVQTLLLFIHCFFWLSSEDQSFRILDTIVCLGSLVWLFSPVWNIVKLTLPGGCLHLSFLGHWPYWFRSNDSSCSRSPRTNAWQFATYLWSRIPAFLPFSIKASCVSSVSVHSPHCLLSSKGL